MGVGRFFCVALPFVLTVGSIIFLLVGALAGVADKSLYIFRINVEDLTIDQANLDNFVENLDIDLKIRAETKTNNITAADLNLAKVYDITLWGYCYTDQDDKRKCEKPRFDWASHSLNTSYIENIGSAVGKDIELPSEIKDSLKAFRHVTKWTEVVFIAAFVALAVEIILGIFTSCSTLMSCCTWIFAGIAAALVCCSAALATAMAAIVAGAVEGTAKFYGVRASINTKFLAIVWIAAAFAIGSALFWVFTICCCKPEKRSRNKNRQSQSGEKLLPTGGSGYAPLGNDHEMQTGYYNQNQSQSQYGAPRYPSGAARSDLAYEPYSHRA